MSACVPADDECRLEALQAYEVLDIADEEAFDRIIRVARTIAETPIAEISLVSGDRQWFTARDGIKLWQTPVEGSFCFHTIEGSVPFIVEDATSDRVLRDNCHVVNEPFIRFYAGFPLSTTAGYNIGALCVIDTVPRSLSPCQVSALQDLASITIDAIELRKLAARDSLTGCLTRQAFAAATAAEARTGPARRPRDLLHRS